MRNIFLFAMAFSFGMSLGAQNLVKNSDFNRYHDRLGPEFRANGGKVMFFTEEPMRNHCGKLIIDKIRKSGQYETYSAACWIGGAYTDNRKPGGFPCKPNTTYDFSIDIKGTVHSAGISFTQWTEGGTLWKGAKNYPTSAGKIKVQKEWTTCKGSFTTKSDADHACLRLILWGNSRYGALTDKAGDYILFDNIVIKERKNTENSMASAAQAGQ